MGSTATPGRLAAFISRFISHPPTKNNILLGFLSSDLSDLMWGLQGHVPEALERLRARRPELQACYLESLQAPEQTFKLAQAARDISLASSALLEDLDLFPLPPDATLLRLAAAVLEASGRLGQAVQAQGGRDEAFKNLELARQAMRRLDEDNQSALRRLADQDNAVEAIKRRETYRHVWRMGEALGRALRTLEDSSVVSDEAKAARN